MNFENCYTDTPYKLLDWIPEEKLDYNHLSSNPRALKIIEKNIDKINWHLLSENPCAIELLENNKELIDWSFLPLNPHAINLIEKELNKLDNFDLKNMRYDQRGIPILSDIMLIDDLSLLACNRNRKVIDLVLKYCKILNCHELNYAICNVLYTNPSAYDVKNQFGTLHPIVRWILLSNNPAAISEIEKNLDNVDWFLLCENPAAIHIIERNLHRDKIDWNMLSKNPAAIHILENNLDKVDWDLLCKNPAAIPILEKNKDKICWACISENPSIFTIDYEYLKLRMKETIASELMANRFHPKNMYKWNDWGFDDYLF